MITTLSQLVAQVETGNNAFALRFEPGWKYTTPDIVKRCILAHTPAYMNETTARNICAISVGRYQIMLSVLYEMGYKGTMAQFMNDTTLQDAWYENYVKARGIDLYSLADILNDPVKRARFALRYNGDAVGYANKLVTVYNAINGRK